MPHPRPHTRPLTNLAHRCRRHSLLPQSRMRTARRRHCHGKDTIAVTTINRHRRTTATASEDDDSHFNAAFAAAVDIAAATAVAAAVTIAFAAAIAAVLALSAAICPLLPPPPSPQPPLMLLPPHPCPCLCHYHYCSLCQRHHPSDAPVDGWLLCHLSPFACCSPRRRAVCSRRFFRWAAVPFC
jgi:hypothetical protein